MQKVIVRAIIAVSTLSIGVAVSLLVTSYLDRTVSPSDIPATNVDAAGFTVSATDLRASRYLNQRWTKVDIDGKFSFFLPPNMRPVEPIGDSDGVRGDFSD